MWRTPARPRIRRQRSRRLGRVGRLAVDLAVELEHRVAAEEQVRRLVVGHGGRDVLGLGPGQEQGDVGRLERALPRLRPRR